MDTKSQPASCCFADLVVNLLTLLFKKYFSKLAKMINAYMMVHTKVNYKNYTVYLSLSSA